MIELYVKGESMRYDTLLTGLERARAKYEETVRALLEEALRADTVIERAVRRGSKAHWTQRPENAKKLAKVVRRMNSAKRGRK